MKIIINGELISDEIKIANGFIKKAMGLIGKKHLNHKEGLLLTNCSQIHCFFMKIPIDAVYLSEDYRVIFIETLYPNRIGKHITKAKHVLELPAGVGLKNLRVGDKIQLAT